MKNTYEIDPTHSSVQFSVRHLMVTNVRGSFRGVKGSVSYDPADPATATFEATIDVNSINTNDEKRDGHLKSADFFDVAKYPTMTFKGTRLEKVSDEEFKATGDLTLHGVTKEVVLTVDEVSKEAKDPWGGSRVGATVKGKIKRSDFGLTYNAPLETGGMMLGDEVKLELDIQFVKTQSAAA
ncbi:MAG TPA: YceI family protein [Bryobacteraceae bacterium]|jgi:polyisoprenoid-binding protein YceI